MQRAATRAWRSSRGPAGLVCAALVVLAPACGGKSKGDQRVQEPGDDAMAKVDPTLCDITDKRVVTFDLNRDGRPDVWKLYQRVREGETELEVLSCKQVDFDHDGRQDYVVGYTRKGDTSFEKFDFDFDGRFDAVFLYEEKSGRLVEVQRDSDFDGRYDLVEVYDANGRITSIKRDRNGDGKPDMWEQYVEGELVAILYDDDYDNRVDRREEIDPREKRARPAAGARGEPDAGDLPDADAGGEDMAPGGSP